jgi:hypothetical protein
MQVTGIVDYYLEDRLWRRREVLTDLTDLSAEASA